MSFGSFLMGGFECSTHRDKRGRRLDLIASTRHDQFAEEDYARLMQLGLRRCRDGVRWHLIEPEPFKYDFSSLKNQVEAARKTGIEVTWDYFHYGFPDDLDIFSPAFVERFVAFSEAVTEYLSSELNGRLLACPVNEISFFSWAAAHVGSFYPATRRRGTELKHQLVRAGIASSRAIKSIRPDAVIMFTDPAIHVVSKDPTPSKLRAAEAYRQAQFEAFDMLLGRRELDLDGGPDVMDVIGLNYYFHNQWHHSNRRKLPLGHPLYRPLSDILDEYRYRYGKPLILAETGIEDDDRPEWFRYIAEQTRRALSIGVDVRGICLYPICNHPGWADDRHCHNGLWDYPDDNGSREVYQPLADEIRSQLPFFERAAAHRA
jgi:beta-glucosidase/6-phospho-beta-glucosidase/beta-galactosidase